MKKTTRTGPMPGFRLLPALVAQALALMCADAAHAVNLDTGNPDWSVRLDSTIRYNLGVRMEKVNPAFANDQGHDETEANFKKGDVVTDRVDLIEDFDAIYAGRHGIRLSVAGWNDFAYGGNSFPNVPNGNNYANDHYDGYARKYIRSGAEVLDAFVFTGFDIGSTTVQLKAGQHNVYWGESLFSVTNSIAYSQGPVDTIKSATSPGAEAKELFLPLDQVSGQWQVADDLTFAAHYMLDWKPFRLVPGGDYFSTNDGTRADYALSQAAEGLIIPNGRDIGPSRKKGNWGANARWNPEWLGGTLGVYYRKFDERLPWSVTTLVPTGIANPPVIPASVRYSYARGTQLWGVSLSQTVGAISIGSEVSYRRNTALVSTDGFTVISPTGDVSYAQAQGARGNTIHALLNAVYLMPKTPLWEAGTLSAELSYVNLNKITSNPTDATGNALFYGKGNAACDGASKGLGCADKSAWGLAIAAEPQWAQVFPGWNLGMPVSLNVGLHGNTPTLGGSTEGTYNWSLGVHGKLHEQYDFTLAYLDSHTPYRTTNGIYSDESQQGAVQNNHGWLSFTFKTTF